MGEGGPSGNSAPAMSSELTSWSGWGLTGIPVYMQLHAPGVSSAAVHSFPSSLPSLPPTAEEQQRRRMDKQ